MQTIFGIFWPFFAIFDKKKDVTHLYLPWLHCAHLKPLAPARITYDNPSDIQDATRGFLQKMLI